MEHSGKSEQLIEQFETAWTHGVRPSIRAFAERVADKRCRFNLLVELICLDIEYRWRALESSRLSGSDPPDHGSAGSSGGAADESSRRGGDHHPMSLGRYVNDHAELGELADIPLVLIEEEYRAQCRWGARPAHEQYAQAFPERANEVIRSLERVDRDLLIETEVRSFSQPTPPLHLLAVYPGDLLRFDDFRLMEMIGAGRVGRVYRALQAGSSTQVAVKYLRKSFLGNPEAVARFVQEAATLMQLDHPGLVSVRGLGTTPQGGLFIVMDLVEGSDLSEHLGGSISDVVNWMVQACRAIGYSHEQGIVHCDLKPANLLLADSGGIRITDFGLARSVSERIADDRIEGTAAFMAPEQVSRWWGKITHRTDLYGLGAVLYALLTSRPPFEGTSLADLLAQVVSGVEVVPVTQLRAAVPDELTRICMRCLAKRPQDRYQSTNQLESDLLGLVIGGSAPGTVSE